MILGIDEVGRGPWAGPLVVGAVILGDAKIDGLTDSKRLTKKQREKLDIEIRGKSAGYGIGWVDAEEIDKIGLSMALKTATIRAVEQIKTPYNEIIIDGTINFLADTNKSNYVTTIKKADLLIPCVSAASIIAKVTRDKFMEKQDDKYPGYEFKKHVGYGTKYHNEAIHKLGITPLHRLSFAPIKKYLIKNPQLSLENTKSIGDNAESLVVQYLKNNGHKIIVRNWKNKYCEIDIVSSFHGVIYFNEVKYRHKSDQGGGFSAINSKKLKQMKFAARYYALVNDISNFEMRLSAISVGGDPPKIEDFLEII